MSESQPTAEAWRRRAMEHHRAGRFGPAADAWASAAELDPAHPETCNNLGVALQSLGKLDDAAKAFAEATRLRPTYPEAWENLAGVLLASGRVDDAIAGGREMIRHLPGSAASHVVLATTLASAARFGEAARTCRDALAVSPDNPDVLYLLANVLAAQEHWPAAADAYTKVVDLAPDALDARVNLGVCLAASGRLADAADRFREVLKRDGSRADAALRLADVLDRLGRQDDALAAAQRAARLRPDDPAALNVLASLTDRAGKSDEAARQYERALAIDPNHAPSLANYATLLARRGEIERAIPMLRLAVAAAPDEPGMHSNLCMYLTAMPGIEPREAFAEHRRWNERHAAPLRHAWRDHANDRTPGRRLRVGYVSPDWAGHPVARFMRPILEAHDREAFEVHVYDDTPKPDAFTDRLRPLPHAWHRVRGMPDDALAEQVRADGIDVLVDLAGHTAGNRLLAFARRPAPVQVSYLGYANTTGLDAIDYRLTDATADPAGMADELHAERLIRLPGTFLAFRPPVETPAVSGPPVLNNGFVTFGSFNALWKVNGSLLELWGRVLNAVPGSRLLMKADGLEDPAVAGRTAEAFGRTGIGRDRLQLVGREGTYAGHLSTYGACDVCLDTFPYAGTTTTCEALWMGVPVVSLAGAAHASRVGASLLACVGAGDLAGRSPDEFVAIARQLSEDRDRLVGLRRGMRERVSNSPLSDAIRTARGIEQAYRDAWVAWCDRGTESP